MVPFKGTLCVYSQPAVDSDARNRIDSRNRLFIFYLLFLCLLCTTANCTVFNMRMLDSDYSRKTEYSCKMEFDENYFGIEYRTIVCLQADSMPVESGRTKYPVLSYEFND